MDSFRKNWLLLAGFGIVAAAAFPGAQARQDSRTEVNPQPLPPGFLPGLVGLASGQHARLSAVSLLPTPAPGEPVPVPGIVLISLFSEAGDLLAQLQDRIAAGESKALDVGFQDLVNKVPPGPTNGRLEIRAAAVGIPDLSNPGGEGFHPPQPCRLSVEIYDADTGKTAIFQEVLIAFLAGDPDRPFTLSPDTGMVAFGDGKQGRLPGLQPPRFLTGLVGLATGQHARLNVVSLLPKPLPGSFPSGPCIVEVTFFTDQGSVIATSTVQVLAGEPKFLDISFEDALLAIPPGPPNAPTGPINRVEIRAAAVQIMDPLTPAGAGHHPPEPCRPSLELYDASSGRTTVALLPAVQ